MPSFEEMQKYYSSSTIGEQLKESSNLVINETFKNSTSYRMGTIYDCDLNKIQEIEFKFIKTKTYSMEQDQVEYMVQFRPGVNPEIDFDVSSDQKHRLGYYLDIKNPNSKLIEKWLIIGKDQAEFDKYNILKCNWLFEWLDKDRNYHSCLGCVRDRNNYNSGVWSDGFSISIENQIAFIVPTNDNVREIDYDNRFMITDNIKYPKTYSVTKLMDTFPLGITKVTLKQSHYNEHTDFCGVDKDFFGDENIHKVCNYYKSSLKPSSNEQNNSINTDNVIWKLSEVNDKIYVKGQPQVIHAIPNVSTSSYAEWHISIDGEDYTNRLSELEEYLDITIDEYNNTYTIAAINKDLAKYVITFAIYDTAKTYYDSVEMEVAI